MHGQALLGPLPPNFRVYSYRGNDGVDIVSYLNTQTNEFHFDNPNLGPLPSQWEQGEITEWSVDDPADLVKFRNKATGEEIDSDPRMLPEALKARGVKLETFSLI